MIGRLQTLAGLITNSGKDTNTFFLVGPPAKPFPVGPPGRPPPAPGPRIHPDRRPITPRYFLHKFLLKVAFFVIPNEQLHFGTFCI